MSTSDGPEYLPDLAGQDVFDEVAARLTEDPLKHLFTYNLDSESARSYWAETEAYRKNTVVVFWAVGKAMLVAAQLTETRARAPSGGSKPGLIAAWSARFIVRLAADTPQSAVDGLAVRHNDLPVGGTHANYVSRTDLGLIAEYQYAQPANDGQPPLDARTLAGAVWHLGGFERDDAGPNFWRAAEPQFHGSLAQLAYLVAPTDFHEADRDLR